MSRRIDSNGYIRNYGKLEHREVYQTYYHCCLLKGIDIDHINGDKTDNRIENLRPVNRKQHAQIHHLGNKYAKKTIKVTRKCIDCGKTESPYRDKRGYEVWNHLDGKPICRKCYSRFKQRERGLGNSQFKIRHPELGNIKPIIRESKSIIENEMMKYLDFII